MPKNESFSSKHLAVSEIVSTFALAFEKSLLLANIKKEFFERFYINRQVVQEAVNFLENKKVDWVKETNRQEIDKSGLLSFNKRKGYSS